MRHTLAVGAVLLVAATGCGGSESATPPSSPPSSSSDGSRAEVEVTDLDSGAVGVADVGGEPWTVLVEAGTVRTADDGRIPVGRAPLRIVESPAGVWVSVIRDGTVVRIDPAAGEVDTTVRLRPRGSEPEGLAWDGTSLWVVDQAHGRVLELSPDGAVLGEYATDDAPRLVSAGESGVWVANYGGTSVTRVADGKARTVPVSGCLGPQGIAEAGGRVWVSCTLSGVVVALDARTLAPVLEVPGLPDADAVVAAGGTVYVIGELGPTVWAIDTASGTVRDTVVLDDAPPTNENVGAAVVGGDLVVTHPEARRIYTLPLP